MSEISDLESRLTAAMDRIARGVDGLDSGASAEMEAELAELRQSLAAEREAADQREERIRALHEKIDAQEAALAEAKQAEAAAPEAPVIDLDANRDLLNQLGRRLRRLRGAVREVKASNQQLRDAAEAGVSDPSLINAALVAELNALKAEREVEKAEADAIVATLRPLLEQGGSDGDAVMEDN